MNKREVREAVEYVFQQESKKPERRFIKLVSYCKGNDGPRNYGTSMTGVCNDPECNNCRNFSKLMQEEFTLQIEELESITATKYLTEEEIIDKYGLTKEDIEKLKSKYNDI